MIVHPYPGLRAFGRDEDAIFFGREDQVDQLLDKLEQSHFLAVVGTSGSGKSSLVRAGLLPALRSGFMAGAGARWLIAEFRPGDRPHHRLAASLVRDTDWGTLLCGAGGDGHEPSGAGLAANDQPTGGGSGRSARGDDARAVPAADPVVADLERDLRRGSLALNWRLGVRPLPDRSRLLILVDQFEELFRYRRTAADEAAAFVSLLLGASSHPSVYVVITLRSEFLRDCADYPELPEAINAGLFLTPRLVP